MTHRFDIGSNHDDSYGMSHTCIISSIGGSPDCSREIRTFSGLGHRAGHFQPQSTYLNDVINYESSDDYESYQFGPSIASILPAKTVPVRAPQAIKPLFGNHFLKESYFIGSTIIMTSSIMTSSIMTHRS